MGIKNIQRGFGFLHVFGLVILIAVSAIGFSAYRKAEAKKAELENQRQESVKRLEGFKRVVADINAIKKLDSEWGEAVSVAGVTSRIALATPVQKLMEIKRKMEELPATGCSAPVKEAELKKMKATAQSFLEFMENSAISSYMVDSYQTSSREAATIAGEKMTECSSSMAAEIAKENKLQADLQKAAK